MSAIQEARQIIQDLLAPELRAIAERVGALEKTVDANEHRAEKRHEEVMAAIRQVSDYTHVVARLSQLEARVNAQAQPAQ